MISKFFGNLVKRYSRKDRDNFQEFLANRVNEKYKDHLCYSVNHPRLTKLAGFPVDFLDFGIGGTHKSVKAKKVFDVYSKKAKKELPDYLVAITSGNYGLKLKEELEKSGLDIKLILILDESLNGDLSERLSGDNITLLRADFTEREITPVPYVKEKLNLGDETVVDITNFEGFIKKEYSDIMLSLLKEEPDPSAWLSPYGKIGTNLIKATFYRPYTYVIVPCGTGELLWGLQLGYTSFLPNDQDAQFVGVTPQGHPLDEAYKIALNSYLGKRPLPTEPRFTGISKSIADKLVTPIAHKEIEFIRMMYEDLEEGRKQRFAIASASEEELERVYGFSKKIGITAEPSGVASLTLLLEEFRKRNNIKLSEVDRILLVSTGG